MKLGDAIVHFGADRSDFQRGLADTERETRTFAGGLGGIMQTGVGVALGNIATQALMWAGRTAVGLAQDAVSAVADFQLMRQGLETLAARELKSKSAIVDANGRITGSTMDMAQAYAAAAPRAKELLDWAIQLGLKSPFDAASVTATLRQGMAYGFTSDEAQRLTEVMLDYAAGTGQSADTMQRVVKALGDIRAKGKLAGQEVIQLSNAGIPIYEILGRNLGKTTAELQDMQMKGLLPADVVIEAILQGLGDFQGAGEAMSNTWAGIISNAKEFKGLALASLFEGILEPLREPLGGWLDQLMKPENLDRLRAIGNEIGQKLTPYIEAFFSSLQNLGDVVAQVSDAWARWGDVIVAAGIAAAIFEVGTAIQGFVALAGAQGLIGAIGTVIPLIGSLAGWVSGLAATFTAAGGGIAGVVAVLGGPVTLVIAAVAAAVGLLYLAWTNNWLGIRDTLTNVWNGTLLPAFQAIVGWLGGALQTALQVGAQAWDWLQQAMARVAAFIQGPVSNAVQTIAGWLSGALTAATNTVSSVWNGTLLPALQAVWGFITGSVIPLFQALANVYIAILKKELELLAAIWNAVLLPALQTVASFIMGVLQGAFNTITNVVQGAVIPTFNRLAGPVLGALHAASSTLSSIWNGPVRSAIDAVSAAFDRVIGIMQGPLNAAINTAKSWLSSLASTVSGVVNSALGTMAGIADRVAGAIGGITGAIQRAIGWLNDLATQIANIRIPDQLVRHSPSPFEKTLWGVGDAVANLARQRLPELAAQLSVTGMPLAQLATMTQKNYYITAQYRNYQSETSLRDTVAALSLL